MTRRLWFTVTQRAKSPKAEIQMMKFTIACVAAAAFAAPACAQSTIETKSGLPPVATELLKNFGQANAQYTGNGAAVGGNGNTDIFGIGSQIDQTPGRGIAVQQALESLGKGSLK
jgi:opacity protein-like surface antigen